MSDSPVTAPPPVDLAPGPGGEQRADGLDAPGLGLRANRLGVPAIVFFVVAAVGPMSGMIGAAALVFGAVGPGAPMVFVLMTAVYLLFAVGFTAMSRYVTNAGGFVAFVALGLGSRAGTATAMLSVLMYTVLMCSFYGIFAVLAHGTFADVFGVDIAWQYWMFGTILLVSLLTYLGVDLSLKTLGVLLILEIIALGVVDVAIIAGGGGESHNSLSGFKPSAWLNGGLGVAMLWAAGVYVGIEATVVFSEEARDRHRTIPRAAYLAIIGVGLFYFVTTWALSNGWGVDAIQGVAVKDPNTFIFTQAETHVSGLWSDFLQVQVVTSFFAVMLGLHNILSRYFFALGRAGVLPAALGRTHRRTQTPHVAVLAITAVQVGVLGSLAVFGADPYVTIYQWLIGLGTVALLLVLALTSFSTIVFFRRTRHETSPWKTIVAPALATAAFLTITVLAITNYGDFAGGQGGAGWLLLLIPAAVALGLAISWKRQGEIDFAARLD